LLARDAVFIRGFLGQGPVIDYLEAGVILIANISSVIGTWLMARAWQVAGLELPGSCAGRATVIFAAIAIAIVIAGPAVYVDFHNLITGVPVSGVRVASDVGDIISFCLIAPVLLTAVALRGGSLFWPWSLLTASMLRWLFYEGSNLSLGRLVHADELT